MSRALWVVGTGAITPVGLDSAQTCAALRAGISAYAESGFLLPGPQWEPVIAACLPFRPRPADSRPNGRFAALAEPAVEQCKSQSRVAPAETALLVGIPERPRLEMFKSWYSQDLEAFLQRRLLTGFHPSSRLLPFGNVSAAAGLALASQLLAQGVVQQCIVGGVDSLVNEADVERLERTWRIHREKESQGLVPGEAASFVTVRATDTGEALCRIAGVGLDQEDAACSVLSDGHPTGKGLERALRRAIADAGVPESVIGLRVSDLNGERYGAMDAMLALSRFYRTDRKGLPVWHPAECVGDTGAATGALLIQMAASAFARGYAPAPAAICELSSESGLRAACIVGAISRGPSGASPS